MTASGIRSLIVIVQTMSMCSIGQKHPNVHLAGNPSACYTQWRTALSELHLALAPLRPVGPAACIKPLHCLASSPPAAFAAASGSWLCYRPRGLTEPARGFLTPFKPCRCPFRRHASANLMSISSSSTLCATETLDNRRHTLWVRTEGGSTHYGAGMGTCDTSDGRGRHAYMWGTGDRRGGHVSCIRHVTKQ